MCEYCTKHGEGKKWYLQVKNYGDDLWNDVRRQRLAKKHFGLISTIAKRDYGVLRTVMSVNHFIGTMIFRMFKSSFTKKHMGQVITIEDAAKIFDIVNSIVRIPCICRKASTGKDVRYCFAVSINPASIGMAEFVNNTYFGGPDVSKFERFSKERALKFMSELEPRGTIHTVWTVVTPFIGFICNCGFDGCLPMRSFKEIGPIINKSEYVAEVKSDKCIGCKRCIKVCLFNSISYDDKSGKSVIDRNICYGCGICRSVCKQNAIELLDRITIDNHELYCGELTRIKS